LACIIRSMHGIENASVLYDTDTKHGLNPEKVVTATVSVRPVGSNQLDEVRVSAIRHLVAGAIASLTPEHVTVCDLNGRTWYGNMAADANAEDNHYASLKRTYEQDLKAKILDALSFIPGVTVEPNVVLGRQPGAPPKATPGNPATEPGETPAAGLTLASARVSVGVPEGYFRKLWQQQHGQQADRPDPAALDQIRVKETAKIERHVAQLLPVAEEAANPNAVTVTVFQEVDQPGHEAAAAGWNRETLKRLGPTWGAMAAVAFVLLCWIAWRSIAHARATAAAQSRPAVSPAARAKPSPMGSPHWRRDSGSEARPPREELSELVAANPDAAANVLRNWIGQVG
jgi:flagellar M-ring protein FliF